MQNLAKHLYRANTHISRVNPRFCLGVSTLRGQAITAPTIDRPSFKRSVSSLRRLLSYSIYLNISAERVSTSPCERPQYHTDREYTYTHTCVPCMQFSVNGFCFFFLFFFFKCLERPNRDKISLLSFFFLWSSELPFYHRYGVHE